MNVGEFFLKLGIKGTEKVGEALSSVGSKLKNVGSMSLEAKAAILSAMYALERLMSSSAKTGAELTNFNALTGISAKTLQQYQYAAAQVGISNEEIASSFKSVQTVMTAMRFGKGVPEGLSMLMDTLQRGGSDFDPNRAKTDIEYVMRKLQEYSNLEKDISKRNLVMKSFGMGENVIAGMGRNAFKPEILQKAPIFTDKETNQLDKVNAAFANLAIKVKMASGHFTAMHGGQLVKDLSHLVDVVLKLANSFVKLAETIHLFEGIGKIFEGWSKIFDVIDGSVKAITGDSGKGKPGGKEQGTNKVTDFFKEMPSVFKAMGEDLFSHMTGTSKAGPQVNNNYTTIAPNQNAAAPQISPLTNNNATSNQTNNNVNQTFHFQNASQDHKQVGNETQKAVTKAFFQIQQGGI